MAIRYGEKARSGEPVGGAGRRSSEFGSASQKYYETEFLSPGSWPWPGKVTYVEVLLVGGGGGGGYRAPGPPTLLHSGAGGGGGVRLEPEVAVSGPVTVTVGSGGSGGTSTPPGGGSAGGTSSFGPISVGGGGGGGSDGGAGLNAPADGGGQGGAKVSPPTSSISIRYGGTGGSYGVSNNLKGLPGPDSPDLNRASSGAGAGSSASITFSPPATTYISIGGMGRYGFGAGGNSGDNLLPPSDTNSSTFTGVVTNYSGQSSVAGGNGAANSGAGGNGWPTGVTTAGNGGTGGSGIVIVRWWE